MIHNFFEYLHASSEAMAGIAAECGIKLDDGTDEEDDDVMIVSNFDKHVLTTTADETMLARGFYKGLAVQVMRRITVKFNYEKNAKAKSHRADVEKGRVVIVDGFKVISEKMIPVIRVEMEIDGALRQALYTIKEEMIEPYKPDGPSMEGDCSRPKKMPRHFKASLH